MEQEFKIKSKNIRISPSPSSWDAIRQRLDEKREKRTVRFNWEVGMAASLIGMLFLVGLLFLNNSWKNQLPSSTLSYTSEFENPSVQSDIYWQINTLHQAYSKLSSSSSK